MGEKVDEVIESVCEKIKNNNVPLGEYAETVKALAALVEARAKLNTYIAIDVSIDIPDRNAYDLIIEQCHNRKIGTRGAI